jgi:hypothetical protein
MTVPFENLNWHSSSKEDEVKFLSHKRRRFRHSRTRHFSIVKMIQGGTEPWRLVASRKSGR